MMKMPTLQPCGRTLLWTLLAATLIVGPVRGQESEEIPLGSSMPATDVSLSDVQGGQSTLGALQGSAGTVVLFWSNQCPWVERYESRFNDLVSTFSGRGISFVLVNSNDGEAYPQEAASASAARFDDAGYPSAVTYLSDASSSVAREFGAERTPHVFVFDENESLVYVGTIDDSPGDPANVQEEYLRDALEAVVEGSAVSVPQTKAFGCTIKFRS